MKFLGLTNNERMTKLADDLELAFMDQTFDMYKQALRDRKLEVKSVKQAVEDANRAIVMVGLNFYDDSDFHMMSPDEMLKSRDRTIESGRVKLNEYVDAFQEAYGKGNVKGEVLVTKADFFTSLSVQLTRKDDATKSVVFGKENQLELSPA